MINDLKEPAPVLIFTYGNPSRGDDALGPAIFDLLDKHQQETKELCNVDLLTDYQLQIEHAVDLEGRKCILFIDASVSASPPYEFDKLEATRDDSYTTHAMSPASVLDVYRQINHEEPPPAFMLTICGYEFSLGQTLTEQAQKNLEMSFEFVKNLSNCDIEKWMQKARNKGVLSQLRSARS